MRLRNIPGADHEIAVHPLCIQTPEEHRGSWQSFFHNQNPIQIEIGMGKGRFPSACAKISRNQLYWHRKIYKRTA